ncbi:hypothetical protein MAR_019861 [Mya arenaria]|uniref:Mab-21-like HhH/H2TH-like domain-containing protein n=1 Tax=Mya arenaria TaxID=6604 RepID=A0ABY7E3A5_MYAAR|nr:hypothetical protein MAR_019861 [Mya arenaria]
MADDIVNEKSSFVFENNFAEGEEEEDGGVGYVSQFDEKEQKNGHVSSQIQSGKHDNVNDESKVTKDFCENHRDGKISPVEINGQDNDFWKSFSSPGARPPDILVSRAEGKNKVASLQEPEVLNNETGMSDKTGQDPDIFLEENNTWTLTELDMKAFKMKRRKGKQRNIQGKGKASAKPNTFLMTPFSIVSKLTKSSATMDMMLESAKSMGLPTSMPCMQCYEEYGPKGFMKGGADECGGRVMTLKEMIKTMTELQKVMEEKNFEIHDVYPDGNCFFTAVVDQLNVQGERGFDADELRLAAVQAVAEVLKKTIIIYGGMTGQQKAEICPKSAKDAPALYLGHLGESHYVSLRPKGKINIGEKSDDEASSVADSDTNSIMQNGCHLIPAFSDSAFNEIVDDFIVTENFTNWTFTFASAEESLCEYLPIENRSCFLLFKALVDATFQGIALPNSIPTSVFFYACEVIKSKEWENHPGRCVYILLKNLLFGFQKKRIPHYFMPSKNLLFQVPDETIASCFQKLMYTFVNPIEAMQRVFEVLQLDSSSLKSTIDEIIVDMELYAENGDFKQSFTNTLYPLLAYSIQNMIEGNKYETACNALLQLETDTEEIYGQKIEVKTIVLSVVEPFDIRTQWCFGLCIDLSLGTTVTKEICEDKPSLHISEVFGPDAPNFLLDTLIPEQARVDNGDLTFPSRITTMLFTLQCDQTIVKLLKYYITIYEEKAGDAIVLPVPDEETQSIQEFKEFFPKYKALVEHYGVSAASKRNLKLMESALEGKQSSLDNMMGAPALYLGHSGESNYVSTRLKGKINKWEKSDDGASKVADSDQIIRSMKHSPLKHINFIFRYIIQNGYVQSDAESIAKIWRPTYADQETFKLDIVGSFIVYMAPSSSSFTEILSKQRQLDSLHPNAPTSKIVPLLYIPKDTHACFSASTAQHSDLVVHGDICKGPIKLSPVRSKRWKGQIEHQGGKAYLQHIEIDLDVLPPYLSMACTHAMSAGRCASLLMAFAIEWPAESMEWINRKRESGFPNKTLVNHIVRNGCHLIPAFSDSALNEIIDDYIVKENFTNWTFTFASAEKNLCEYLPTENRTCFLLFKAFVEVTFQGIALPNSIPTSVFLYACEVMKSRDWENQPGRSVYILLKKLLFGFQRKCIPHYFMPSKNLLFQVPDETIASCFQKLMYTFVNPIEAMQRLFKFLQLDSSSLKSTIEEIIIDMELFAENGDFKHSFTNILYPLLAFSIQSMIQRRTYVTACEALLQLQTDVEETYGHGCEMSSIILQLIESTDIRTQWCFGLCIDISLGTTITKTICEGKPAIHISEVFGPDAPNVLLDTLIPEQARVDNGDLTFPVRIVDVLLDLQNYQAIVKLLKYYITIYETKAGDSNCLPVADYETQSAIIHQSHGGLSTHFPIKIDVFGALTSLLEYLYVKLFNACLYSKQVQEFRVFFPKYKALVENAGLTSLSKRNLEVMETALEGRQRPPDSMMRMFFPQ